MKCETCLDVLEEYFDGELAEVESSRVAEHLITCADCSTVFASLTAEQEIFARYDRNIDVSPKLWDSIAERTAPVRVYSNNNGFLTWLAGLFTVRSLSFAGAAAVLLLAILIGVAYVNLKKPAAPNVTTMQQQPAPVKQNQTPENQQQATVEPEVQHSEDRPQLQAKHQRTPRPQAVTAIDQSDVISADLGFDLEDEDTTKHLEQTQILLRSIRNVTVSDGDDEVDMTYDKALSRRLLNENIVLRRDAEMRAKYPTKSLLSDVEPLLIDIANLPDRARPDEVRTIQERVKSTEIVAALSDYQGRVLDR